MQQAARSSGRPVADPGLPRVESLASGRQASGVVMLPLYWILLLLFVLAAGSFFFAAAETAFFSLASWRVRQLIDKDPRRGPRVADLLSRSDDLLATLVLGNTVANFLLIAVVLVVTAEGGWERIGWEIVLLVVLVVGCELAPKALAVRSPEWWALRLARVLGWMVPVCRPIRRVSQGLVQTVLRPLVKGSIPLPAGVSDEEYADLVDLAHQHGALGTQEREIILRILALEHRTARDAMRPRASVVMLSDDLEMGALRVAARRSRHHRIPLYDETPDTIVAILNTRQFLLHPEAGLDEALEFPSFVPESMNLLTLFQALQSQQRGMALVLDEFGGMSGLITIEDILEVVVGPIRGEGEAEGFVMEPLGPGRWRTSGAMRLDDFVREHPALGTDPDVDTLGGLVVKLCEVVPAVGETVSHRGLRFTVKAADDRRVRELLVEREGGAA